MTEDRVEIEIDTSPDAVWSKVRDFGAVGDFLDGIDSVRLEGDDRVIGMFGLEVRERLVVRDDQNRSITYSVIDGVPIERHSATITVTPSGDGSTVVWSFDVTPDEMAPIFSDTYAKGLQALKTHLGG